MSYTDSTWTLLSHKIIRISLNQHRRIESSWDSRLLWPLAAEWWRLQSFTLVLFDSVYILGGASKSSGQCFFLLMFLSSNSYLVKPRLSRSSRTHVDVEAEYLTIRQRRAVYIDAVQGSTSSFPADPQFLRQTNFHHFLLCFFNIFTHHNTQTHTHL